ncbi:MAG: Nif3-like dinuclear metal center hexameric protein [Saprospiraceae bacterium]|nr:Nif3-like dinuclear metal center hexameric protein [Saprospiraceae bacterium]
MTTVGEIARFLESIAPLAYQEDYDNAGLLTGAPGKQVSGVLVCLDATEAVIDEAIERGCNLVVTHHPILFKAIKKLTGATHVERALIKAIKNDVAIYVIHTNLDNVYYNGVNQQIADKLGLQDTRILQPSAALFSLVVTLPASQRENLCTQLTTLGAEAGTISPVQLPEATQQAFVQITFKVPGGLKHAVLEALRQNNALEIADYSLHLLDHKDVTVGAGMIGYLPTPITGQTFLQMVKDSMAAPCVRYTAIPDKPIQKVAFCGGSGSFLLPEAIRQGADVFLSSDFKYHQFFDATDQVFIADIGHFESEQYTTPLLADLLSKKFTNFAVHCVKTITNPVNYFF